MHDDRRTATTRGEQRRSAVERAVRARCPGLTPTASRLLARELRDVIGSQGVRPAPGRMPNGRLERNAATPSAVVRRPVLLVSLIAALTVGAIVALVTHSWWALVAAGGLHAAGTLLAAGGAFELMTRAEHVSPDVAARLEEEGVADPDRVLTELVRGLRHGRRRTPGHGVRALFARRPVPLAAALVVGVMAFMALLGLIVHRL